MSCELIVSIKLVVAIATVVYHCSYSYNYVVVAIATVVVQELEHV